MTYRAVLQVVEDVGGIAQPVFVVASCATCRWAEALDPIIIEEPYRLQCRRFSYDAMWRTDANLRMDGALLSGEENDTGDSRVYVAPTFGCVQWEAK